jgi:microcystin-dependent protein
VDNLVSTLTEQYSSLIDIVYPIGSIYMSVNAADPSTLFSGTSWEKLEGRFLLGSNSTYNLGSTGGEATHTLTYNEMPKHTHPMYSYNPGGDGTWTPDEGSYLVDSVTDNKNTWWARLGMGYAGGGAAHNNMPPYLVVNMWKRTS